MTRAAPRRPSAEDGSALEGTIVAAFFVAIVIPCLLQFGAWYQAATAAKIAARQGATAASYAGASTRDGEQAALDFVAQQGGRSLLDAEAEASTDGSGVHVTVLGRASRVVPFVPLAVHGDADALIERFRTESER